MKDGKVDENMVVEKMLRKYKGTRKKLNDWSGKNEND